MSKKKEPVVPTTTITVGECYLFDDVTSKMWIGRVLEITGPHTVTLSEASWVADTGQRLSEFVKNGRCDGMEIEYVGVKGVHWAGWSPWTHSPFTKSYPE